jgi:hypothetical protein
MSKKIGFLGLMIGSIGSAIVATFLVVLLIEGTLDGVLEDGGVFFGFVMLVIGISVMLSIKFYDWQLKEKIHWSY